MSKGFPESTSNLIPLVPLSRFFWSIYVADTSSPVYDFDSRVV